MSTTTVADPPARETSAPSGPSPATGGRTERLTFPRVLASEWIKLRSLRSTWTTLGSIFAVIAVFGVIAATMSSGSVETDQQQGPGFGGGSPVDTVLSGANLALLIVGVLGALIGAREYSSGQIRITLAAVPGRLKVLAGKILVFVAVALPILLAAVLVAFFAGMQILSGADQPTATWSDPGVARTVLGNVAYLVGIGVIGLCLGILLRSIASSIGVLLGGLLFLPALASALLPDSWDSVLKYLPANAGSSFTAIEPQSGMFEAAPGAAVFAAWVVAGIIAAAAALRSRDA